MKYLSLFVVACLALSSSSTDAAAPFISNGSGTTAIPGSYIVVLKDNHNATLFQTKFDNMAARVQNARGGRRPKMSRKFSTIPGFTVTSNRNTVTELLNMDEVAYIEQDALFTIQASQANPPSWGLPRVSTRNVLKSLINYVYPNAAGAGVTAYVVDTGINVAHSDFGGRAKMGANFIQGSPNTDENGHGTHVSGTIGGTRFGVAKKVNLVGVKVLNAQGSGSTSGIVAAMDWIITVNKGKKAVVNMSLGGGGSKALNDAAGRLYKANIPVIVAAGNDGNLDACNGSPSGAPAAFTVAASDVRDTIASFSSWGKCVEIFGPGVQITSAWIGSKTATNTISGTSMATPHVVGVAALYLSNDAKLKTAQQVYNKLTSTATKNAIKGNLRGTPNLLVFNGAEK
ncbi:peptidase S8/S53 domain-containing protein [Gamsiella multidivaricata]|uniref:peptidase S8/S53 domain-containing protein n=1 Tax=Gamsiella multidivaricata TaxID=101098 RepID=UPI00221E6C5E|nr:peptidase S8/S53 domain-containing protein [Gamsiella multidivaricata]KAG0365586.1 subtilisin-like serine protease [Gamsiella multidivaricata]KAI7831742.1 peptidase S8/S53 domain-containing protein [Gamsiella multidivaricata]